MTLPIHNQNQSIIENTGLAMHSGLRIGAGDLLSKLQNCKDLCKIRKDAIDTACLVSGDKLDICKGNAAQNWLKNCNSGCFSRHAG
jgi:hypothetical protein